jgi:hypothetical protein
MSFSSDYPAAYTAPVPLGLSVYDIVIALISVGSLCTSSYVFYLIAYVSPKSMHDYRRFLALIAVR